MPSCIDLLVAAGRFGPGSTLTVLLPLAARRAFADHGVPAVPRGGFGWLSWLLVAGAVVAVGLAAWAFFAPDDKDKTGGAARSDRPRVEPPIR
jgi:hypothetical protein